MLKVSARQSGNQILIDILDDGRGIDGKRLVEKAIAAGILDSRGSAAVAARAAGADLRGRAFDREGSHRDFRPRRRHGRRPRQYRADRRLVDVDSTPGEGTRMTLRVPLTLTIIPSLTVSIGAQHFAIPRSAIEEIVRANGESRSARADRRRASRPSAAAACRGLARRDPRPRINVAEVDATLIVLRPAGGDSTRSRSTASTITRNWW